MDENREFSQQETDGEFGRLFRTAFHGFNRQDVVEYIARLTRDQQRERENVHVQMRELEDIRDMLNRELAALRKDNAALTAQLYQAQERMEAAQAELAQTKTDVQTRIEEATGTLAAQSAQKDEQIEALELKTAQQHQLLLAAYAENALLTQQAQVNAHAAAQYAALLDAASQTQTDSRRVSDVQVDKLVSRLRNAEPKAQSAPSARQQEPKRADTAPQTMETGKAAPETSVQSLKTALPKRTSGDKKWMNALISKLLND